MTEMIAYCGLACHTCVAYQATLNNDDSKRQEIAGLWSKMYGSSLEPGVIPFSSSVISGTSSGTTRSRNDFPTSDSGGCPMSD